MTLSPCPRIRLSLLLGLSLLLAAASPAARAQQQAAQPAPPPAASSPLTPEEARHAVSVLEDDKQRTELLRTLHAIAKADPQATQQAQADPAPAAAPPPATAPDNPAPITSGGLVDELAGGSASWFSGLSEELTETVTGFAHVGAFARWAQSVARDPQTRLLIFGGAWRLAVALIAALGGELVTRRMVRGPAARGQGRHQTAPEPETERRQEKAAEAPAHLLQRLPLALARLALDLLPVVAFAAIGNLLIVLLGGSEGVNAVLGSVVNAYAIWRGITVLTRALVAPNNPQLRLFAVDTALAGYIDRWVSRLAAIAVFGLALVGIADIVGLYPAAYHTLSKLVLLIDHIMLAVVVIQSRRRVAHWIQAPANTSGATALMRNRLAQIWPALALFLIVASWVVFSAAVQEGYLRLLRLALLTALVLFAARFAAIVALGTVDRLLAARPAQQRLPGSAEPKVSRLFLVLRRLTRIAVGFVTLVVLLEIWGVDAVGWFNEGIGQRLLSAILTIGFAALAAMAIWEWITATVDRYLHRLQHEADYARLARMRTLLPIMRTTLLVVILAVVGLTALSEVGVNIAPMLAGAGILGIAVGFGSQKLVQDVITGIFLLIENALQVGDCVSVAGFSGNVEHISIRSIRLRDVDGSVHIVPFSSVTSVTNSSRENTNAMISVVVDISEDTERVENTLRAISEEMRHDPDYQKDILSDIELWGVDKIDGARITIAAQIHCVSQARLTVQREFNRRLVIRLRDMGVKLVGP